MQLTQNLIKCIKNVVVRGYVQHQPGMIVEATASQTGATFHAREEVAQPLRTWR